MPKISVIVPVYNVKDYLHRCIDNILIQLFTDFELIVVDDGSPDCSGCICDEYIEFDSRITVIHKKNGGLSSARNIALDLSFKNRNSEWITFIDSDDWVHYMFLRVLHDAAVKSGSNISVCGYQEVLGEKPIIDSVEDEIDMTIVNTEVFFCEHNVNAVIACGKLYKLDLFSNIRFPFGKLHEDEFTIYQLLFVNQTLSIIRAPLYYYYINEKSITQSDWLPNRLDALEAFEKNIEFFYKKNYRRAYIKSIKKLEWGINTQQEEINVSNNYRKEDYEHIFSYYYRVLLRYGKKEKMYPFSVYHYYYEAAFPKTMKYYWIFYSIIRKLLGR